MIKQLLKYGCIGLLIETLYTGIYSGLFLHDSYLTGYTYLWMHPIWAIGIVLLKQEYKELENAFLIVRAFFYIFTCFVVELMGAFFLYLLIGEIPWDYTLSTGSRWVMFDGAIRLDYAPLWMIAGFTAEYAFKKEWL